MCHWLLKSCPHPAHSGPTIYTSGPLNCGKGVFILGLESQVICEDVPDFKEIRREVVEVVCWECEQFKSEMWRGVEEREMRVETKGEDDRGDEKDRKDDEQRTTKEDGEKKGLGETGEGIEGLEDRDDDGLLLGVLKGLARSASRRSRNNRIPRT
ncbi:hypothetical protein K491DRAFT_680996 [Lophiostoma macrostomum CBS 122681]|uniref:Uncharacterized protein n=1 Tax=Lophiostoma macrostomum CBS 122681 TaxID=1314788 RepID=A0A6A6SZ92_9PLEO|nr:hypothetical protein K491DRAFT_680996 [Lophiostoma macrostomum CBS 122681]